RIRRSRSSGRTSQANIGAIARPRNVYVVNELPKTRSGKIMRRLLKDAAEGRKIGDTTTLADTMVMQLISDRVVAERGGAK
ncbi:hypothetical protein SD72_13045, partial [Leucobacter komagatae]